MAHGAGVKVECYDDRFDCNSRPVPEQRALRVYLVCSNPAADKRCKNRLDELNSQLYTGNLANPPFSGGNFAHNPHCPESDTRMDKTLEIGSTEYIRAHVQKLNDRDAEIDVSAAHGPDLQRFTEQQITDYCEKVENLCLICRNDGALMFESVQIIRHLQGELNTAGERLEDEGLIR